MSSKASPIVLDDTEPEDEGPSTPRVAAIHVIPPTSPAAELASTPTSHALTVTQENSPEPLASGSAMDEDEPEPGTDDVVPPEPMDVDDAADGEQAEGEADDESESDSDSEDEPDDAQGPSQHSEEDITRSPTQPSPPASQAPLPPANGTAPATASEPAESTPTPATANAAGLSSKPNSKGKPASQAAKPKSKRVHKSPTPPPPPPPPLQTVRLEIKLGRGSNREYAFDLAQMAEEKGMRIRPPPPRKLESDSEPDSAEEMAKALDAAAAAADAAAASKKKRKRKRADEQYDLEDDFIDDTELAIEERKFFAQTKQTGFYVSSGEVALLREKVEPTTKHRSPKKPTAQTAPSTPIPIIPPSIPLANKPNAKRSSLARTLQSLPGLPAPRESPAMKALVRKIPMPPPLNQGTPDNPIPLDGNKDEDDEGGEEEKHEEVLTGGRGTKRKASMGGAGVDGQPDRATPGDGDMVAEPRKRRKVHDLPQFSKELQPEIEMLKQLVDREEQAFSIRGKFPQHVKPILAQVALKAIVLDEYDDEFFDAMPKIFPYNRFTMKKLITRIVYPHHVELLNRRCEELLAELKKIADDGFENAQAEHARAVAAWESKQAKKKAEAADAAVVAPPVAVENGADGEREDKPPKQKFKLTEAMRTIIWNLVCLSNDCAALSNEKNKLENITENVSEQGLRKVLYQKINSCFPDGWMDTGILSREVSSLKKKQGRENMAELPDGAT